MAGQTGLEPATSGVTGRHSNRLSYYPLTNTEYEQIAERDPRCQGLFDDQCAVTDAVAS